MHTFRLPHLFIHASQHRSHFLYTIDEKIKIVVEYTTPRFVYLLINGMVWYHVLIAESTRNIKQTFIYFIYWNVSTTDKNNHRYLF